MPADQGELEAAWQALAERERRGEEATRQRADELEDRSARVAALWEEVGERSTELAAQEANLGEREQALIREAEDLRRREGLVRDAEARVEAGRRQQVDLETMQAEVSARLIEVDERGEWVAATEVQLAQREQSVTEREHDVRRNLTELEARESAVASLAPREAELTRLGTRLEAERARVAELLAEAERRLAEVWPREEDARRRAAAVDEREPRVQRLAEKLEDRGGRLAVAEAKVANALRDVREEQ